MVEKGPVVSIIVPCRNEKDHIETCIRSILSQKSPPGGFEIIVADGMSDDGTRDILTRFEKADSRVHVIDNPKRIAAAGLNLAIKKSRGEIILRMDAHTQYAPDYVDHCLKALNTTKADNVGGPARTISKGYVQSVICAAYHSTFGVGGARFHNVDYEGRVDTVTYGCWRREVFTRVGFFDEELARSEDDEFNLRIHRAGGVIWQSPKIRSWYSPRNSLADLWRQCVRDGYWKVRVIQKHRIPASVRHLVPATFLASVVFLPILGMWWGLAGFAWLVILASYLATSFGASVWVSIKKGWRLFPLLPVVFACYHFGYGFGFWRGVIDFLILQKKPTVSYLELTRT